MSKKKKVLIGAGVAAVAIAGIAGTVYVGKKVYDKRKAQRAGISREVVDDGPESPALAAYHVPHPKTFMDTVAIPDAVALGLSYDEDTGAKLNLLLAAFDASGQNLGYVQAGGQLQSLFNGAISHTGETHAASTGDSENVIVDLRATPANVSTVMFGTYLVNPGNGRSKAYVHMLPVLRNEQIQHQESTGGTREIDYDSDEESSGGSGTRGVGAEEEEDDDESYVRLFYDDLCKRQDFLQQRGFVAGKISRNPDGFSWSFSPYRTVVNADPQFGLWPALEHYAKPTYSQQGSYPQQGGYPQQQPGYY